MKKGTGIMISIAACFVCLIGGIFLGRNMSGQGISVDSSSMQNQLTVPTSAQDVFESGKININTAGVDELTLLPNIGEKLANRIIEYRRINGYFQSIEDLAKVEGIGQSRIAQISNYITTGE